MISRCCRQGCELRIFVHEHGIGTEEAIRRLTAMGQAQRLAYAYGMSPKKYKKWKRKKVWAARMKWLWKWVGGSILCFAALS